MAEPEPERSRAVWRGVTAVVVVAALVALAVAWRTTRLGAMLDVHTLVAMGQAARTSPFAPLGVIVVCVVGGLVAMPMTAFIGATIVVFGAFPGGAYALFGGLANAAVIYAIGRFAGRAAVERYGGDRVNRLSRELARRGVVAMALVRFLPAPFSLINLLAGASQIRFSDFMLGTALGLVPVIALLALVVTEVTDAVHHPSVANFGWLAVAVLAITGLGWLVRRVIAKRYGAHADHASDS